MSPAETKRTLAKYGQTINMLVRAHNHAIEIDGSIADRIQKIIATLDGKVAKLS